MMRISVFTVITLFPFISLFPYDTLWKDPLLGTTHFRLHGLMWFGYDHTDSNNGIVDEKRKHGFNMNRIFIRIDGKVEEGTYKDWRYHITLEGNPSLGEDDYRMLFIKFAFVSLPLTSDLFLILGQQNTPTTTGSLYSLESMWNHRYLDEEGKSMWDQTGTTSTSDLGVSLEWNKEFWTLNLFFANGEGSAKRNADKLQNEKLEDLALGKGDSYGYHLYGKITFLPLGSGNEKVHPFSFYLHFPFLWENFTGIQRKEYEITQQLDFIKKEFQILRGDPAAKQDISYGWEGDGIYRSGFYHFVLGAGQIFKKDRRKPAYKIDSAILTNTPSPGTLLKEYYYPAADGFGYANYIFGYIQYKSWKIISRYYENTDDGSLKSKITPREGISLTQQLIFEDIKENDILGDLSLDKMVFLLRSGNIDLQKSLRRTYLYAIEYTVNPRFRIAAGGSYSYTLKKNGEPLKITPFLSDSIVYRKDSFAKFLADTFSLPYPLSYHLRDEDLLGKKRIDSQLFIKSQFVF